MIHFEPACHFVCENVCPKFIRHRRNLAQLCFGSWRTRIFKLTYNNILYRIIKLNIRLTYLNKHVMMFASCLEALGINSILSISYKDNWGILRDSFVKWRKWKICGIWKRVTYEYFFCITANLLLKLWVVLITSHIVSISSLILSVKKLSGSPSFTLCSSSSFRFLVLHDILPVETKSFY